MSDWGGKRLLVTGGAGFIGAALVRALLEAGADVTVADLRAAADPRVRSVVGDLGQPEVLDEALEAGTDGVFHLAAFTSVLRSVERPDEAYQANVAVTAAVLERARKVQAQGVLLASTNAVVGDVGRNPITERLPLLPLSPYGATKAAAEVLLSAYHGSYGMTTASLRLTNVYGPGMARKDSFVPRLMRAALSGKPVQIYGDGEQVRDYVHVDDVVAAFRLAWSSGVVGPLIVGSGRSVSVNHLVGAARKATGAALPVGHVGAKAGEMPAVIVDIARAQSLGFAPAFTLEAGLRSAWDYFRGMSATEKRTAEGERG
ncbi:MAG: NAD-dependent epimerase/dehydratase family protein [Actinomycetota bacterium]|nr:NAD-dependent epimerase/dehydratase family protein [Euzebyaceae bacterium]MDQ3451430.1 NAD-dependent epimerase/dehydratase family protein [Actinomycetota bacterium]